MVLFLVCYFPYHKHFPNLSIICVPSSKPVSYAARTDKIMKIHLIKSKIVIFFLILFLYSFVILLVYPAFIAWQIVFVHVQMHYYKTLVPCIEIIGYSIHIVLLTGQLYAHAGLTHRQPGMHVSIGIGVLVLFML